MRLLIVAACVALGLVGLAGLASVADEPRRSDGVVLVSDEPKKKKQEVVGAVWEFEAREHGKKTDAVLEKGRFRATLDGRIYSPRGDLIGSYAYTNKVQDEVRLKFDKGKLKGTVNLVKVGIKEPTWKGTWKLEDGSSARLHIKMLKD